MSIRIRLVVMCLVVALLPAVPLTFLVKTLFDKSFDLGLNPTMEEALQSGLSVSRAYLDGLRTEFNRSVLRAAGDLEGIPLDSARVAAAVAGVNSKSPGAIDGFALSAEIPAGGGNADKSQSVPASLPPVLRPFAGNPEIGPLLENTPVLSRQGDTETGYSFFETEDRSLQLAAFNPADAEALSGRIRVGVDRSSGPRGKTVLFYKKTSPEFLAHAGRLLDGRQKFAELRLMRTSLSRSFFYPFIIIYAVCLLIALGLALLMAERLAYPIRRLVFGANAVADGDLRYRLKIKASGETGRLVGAFNDMVSRLDSQRRRLVDMEKMATWREMARHLAHEIKNPLLPIRLTIEELRDQYKGGDDKYKEMLDDSTRVVGDELDNLQGLVKEFSSFARMPDMNPQVGSVERLVKDVAQMYPAVETRLDTDAASPDLSFDPDQIRRVLVNLFDNAVSVSAEGKLCKVRVTLKRVDAEVVLSFADNGPGIPPGHADKIFEPYFTTRSEGTGLGLAMIKKIILLHGGSITATNQAGGGAVFEIRLPINQKES